MFTLYVKPACCVVILVIGPLKTIPALLIKIVTSPNFALDASPAAFTSSSDVTLHLSPMALPFSYVIISAVHLASSSLRSLQLTLQPNQAIFKAKHRPIPLPAPVIKTCSPSRDFLNHHPLYLRYCHKRPQKSWKS